MVKTRYLVDNAFTLIKEKHTPLACLICIKELSRSLHFAKDGIYFKDTRNCNQALIAHTVASKKVKLYFIRFFQNNLVKIE